jgi:hypothetical protein
MTFIVAPSDGLARLRNLREHLEYVDHAVPDLQLDVDAGGLRFCGQFRCVITYGLAVADLHQQRRQAGEIGVKRRGQRITGIAVLAEIVLRQRQDHRALVDRVGLGPARIARAGSSEIGPGRHQRAGGW